MLYRAVTGIEPFSAATLAGILLALTTKDPPPVREVAPEVDPGLAEIIQQCLAKRPEQRIQTACLLILTVFAVGLVLYWLRPVALPFVLAVMFALGLTSLIDLQDMNILLLRPDIDLGLPGLDLADAERDLLVRALTDFPSESESPRFDPEAHPDDWPHFFLPGVERIAPRDELRIANKVGLAYGFVSETAYVEHTPTGRCFLLAAAVYTNDNAVLNDGVYEYDLALRVMEDLGEAFAARVFGRPDPGPAPGASIIDAPTRWAHEHRRILAAENDPVVVGPGGVWASGPIRLDRPAIEVIASWNVRTPPGAGMRLEVRARGEPGAWSPWLPIAEAGEAPPDDPWTPTAPGGPRTDIDTLIAPTPVAWIDLRVRSAGGETAIHRLDLCATAARAEPDRVRDDRGDGRAVAETPYLANTLADPEDRSRICSVLSVRMLLAHRGVEPPLDDLARAAHDDRHGIYGNWTNAVQAAFEHGVPGYLTRFEDWTQVRRHIETTGPIAISIRFDEGELSNASYDSESGHIIVLYGLDERGDALVLDPALSPEPEARRTYDRDELSEVWLRRVKGLAYVLLPPPHAGTDPAAR